MSTQLLFWMILFIFLYVYLCLHYMSHNVLPDLTLTFALCIDLFNCTFIYLCSVSTVANRNFPIVGQIKVFLIFLILSY